MFTIKEYLIAENLDHAYEVLKKNRNNTVLGGLLWLKMGNKNINTAIDLSSIGLDKIEEDENEFRIGCMVTLRDLEKSEALNKYFNGAFKKSVESIVGTQFRNLATVGGSIYSRFGFSDPLTMMLALDAYVEMYSGGIIPLYEFVNIKYERDILVRLIIKKDNSKISYLTHRLSATDFPVLAVSVSLNKEGFKISVGARPNRANLAVKASSLLSENPSDEEINTACNEVVNELVFGTNLRGSKEYRELLAKTLVKRAIKEVVGGNYAS